MWQPSLETSLVRLRPLLREDFDALFTAASDPSIWAQHPASDRHRPEVFRAFFEDALACGGALVFEDRASGAVIGSSRFVRHDPARREIEIGYTFLVRACWGGLYNGEIKRAMIAHALTCVDVVWFSIGEHNVRSRRAMEKIGGVLTERVEPSRPGNIFYRIDRATLARAPTRAAALRC